MEESGLHKLNPRTQPLRVYLWSVLFLIIVTAGSVLVVRAYKRPGQMTLIESQGMDMTAMKAPVGSVPVALETVETKPFGAAVEYAGAVVPYTEQEVYPRVEGWIAEMAVYPGDRVKKGQLLARLESPDLAQRTAAAASDASAAADFAAAAGNDVERMRKMEQAAGSARDSMRAEATFRDSELARMEKLYSAGAISKSELDQERAMNASAHAELNKMESELEAAGKGRETAEREKGAMDSMARSGGSRAAAERSVLGWLELRSGVDGVVTERLVAPGTLARPGVPVLRIADISRVRLQANVSEADAAMIAAGNTVEVTTPRRPGETFSASVTTVFPASDPTTRTSIVEVVTDNADGLFLPGDFVTMRIGTGGGSAVLSVPDRAIGRWGNSGRPFVWAAIGGGAKGEPVYTCVMHPEVIAHKPGKCPKCGMDLVPKESGGDLKAHRVTVELGLTNGDRTEILSGLEPGDRVVIDGGGDLSEGDTLFETKWSADGPKELPPAPGAESKNKGKGMDMPGM